MKKSIFLFIFALVTVMSSRLAAQSSDTFFPYPQVPEEKTLLSERCNYLVDHFWDRCNLKQSFSSKDKLHKSFGDWLSFMPYATADTVHLAIDKFIANVSKLGPDNMLAVAKIAESWLYADSAEYFSEEIYLPFAKAVADHKKVSKANKARYGQQARILENSMVGNKVPSFEFVTPDGSKQNFGEVIASRVIIFFNDPDCIDCSLIKARLSADYNVKKLLENGLLKVVAIYPGAPTQEWKDAMASVPSDWIVGAVEDIDTYLDVPSTPDLYYLDARHKVLGKHFPIDNLLYAIQSINMSMEK